MKQYIETALDIIFISFFAAMMTGFCMFGCFVSSYEEEGRFTPVCGASKIEVVEIYKDQQMKIIHSAGGLRFLIDRNDQGLELGRCYNVVHCTARGSTEIQSYREINCKGE